MFTVCWKPSAKHLPRGLYQGFPPGSHRIWLTYCSDDQNCIEINASGIDSGSRESTTHVRLMLGGERVNTGFNGSCRPSELNASATRVSGSYTCKPIRGQTMMEKLEFSATP